MTNPACIGQSGSEGIILKNIFAEKNLEKKGIFAQVTIHPFITKNIFTTSALKKIVKFLPNIGHNRRKNYHYMDP
jgi:hypothetical protein